ncbi:MAG: hypothetical protein AABY22_00855 [Nanoarchaeota archaeon]
MSKIRRIKLENIVGRYIGEEVNAPSENSSGPYKDFENVKQELIRLEEELGHFPSYKEVYKQGLSKVLSAITRHHGGYRSIREKLCREQVCVPKGYWDDAAHIEDKLKTIILEIWHFPTERELRHLGHFGLLDSLNKKHQGLANMRACMGYRGQRPRGYWKNPEHIKKTLTRLCEELGHFPTQQELNNKGYSRLAYAITKHYGSFALAREKFGFPLFSKPRGYWKSWSNVREALDNAIKQLGHFPKQRELVRIGYVSLPNAIVSYHGGLDTVKKNLEQQGILVPSEQNKLEKILDTYVGEQNGE